MSPDRSFKASSGTVSARRSFLRSGLGAGSLALTSMLWDESRASDGVAGRDVDSFPGSESRARTFGRAQRVILLFMAGGPSQIDTFDPKEELTRLAGKTDADDGGAG